MIGHLCLAYTASLTCKYSLSIPTVDHVNKLCIFIVLSRVYAILLTLLVSVLIISRRGIVQPLSSYVASSSGWVSWSYDVLLRRPVQWGFRSLVKQPMSWAYSKLTGNDGSASSDYCRPKSRDQLILDFPDEYFVVVDLVKVVN